MKIATRRASQGEIRFVKVRSIPEDVTKKDPRNGKYIVGHSETGHHHILEARPGVEVFGTSDPMIDYVSLRERAPVIHEKPGAHQHKTFLLDVGDWKIVHQQEWTPEGMRKALD